MVMNKEFCNLKSGQEIVLCRGFSDVYNLKLCHGYIAMVNAINCLHKLSYYVVN